MAMDLSRCDLTGADLRGRDLSGADLRGADLSRATVDDARFDGALLTGARLDQWRAERAGATFVGAMGPLLPEYASDLDRRMGEMAARYTSPPPWPPAAAGPAMPTLVTTLSANGQTLYIGGHHASAAGQTWQPGPGAWLSSQVGANPWAPAPLVSPLPGMRPPSEAGRRRAQRANDKARGKRTWPVGMARGRRDRDTRY